VGLFFPLTKLSIYLESLCKTALQFKFSGQQWDFPFSLCFSCTPNLGATSTTWSGHIFPTMFGSEVSESLSQGQ
jgi:hypothetical protein